MIQLSLSGKIHYQMLNQIVVLLVLTVGLMLLSAMQTLPHVSIFPAQVLEKMSSRLLHLTLLTGIITAGLIMRSATTRWIRTEQWLYRLWGVLIFATLLFSGFQFGWLLDVLTAALLLVYLLITHDETPSPYLRVWEIGMMLIIGSLFAKVVVVGQLATILTLFQTHVAYAICGVSITFWLMTRWSHVRAEWARDGVMIVATLIGVAGLLISFAPIGYPAWLGGIVAGIVPIPYMILAGHSYRALKDRNHNQSLSPHWIGIAVLFWLAGGGFLGMISTQAGIQRWMTDTALVSAQLGLMNWGILTIILSLVNNTAAELRGENRRVTGYMPLWMIAFGSGFAFIVQACLGVLQIYLGGLMSLDSNTVDGLLIPLHMIWILCLIAVVIGITIYALGFWVRRPTIMT